MESSFETDVSSCIPGGGSWGSTARAKSAGIKLSSEAVNTLSIASTNSSRRSTGLRRGATPFGGRGRSKRGGGSTGTAGTLAACRPWRNKEYKLVSWRGRGRRSGGCCSLFMVQFKVKSQSDGYTQTGLVVGSQIKIVNGREERVRRWCCCLDNGGQSSWASRASSEQADMIFVLHLELFQKISCYG